MKCSISPTEIPQFPALFNILPHVKTTYSLNTLSDIVKTPSADSCGESEHFGKNRLQAQGYGMLVGRKSRQVIPLAPWRLIFKNIWKISKDYCEISEPLKQLLLPSWEADNPVNMLGKRGGDYSSLSPLSQCCRRQCSLAPCPSCCPSHLHQHWRLWGDVDVIQIQSNLAKQASSLHPAGSLLRLTLWPCESWCQQQPEAGNMQQGQAGWLLVASCWLWVRDCHVLLVLSQCWHVCKLTQMLGGSQDGLMGATATFMRLSLLHQGRATMPQDMADSSRQAWICHLCPFQTKPQHRPGTWSLPCCYKNVEYVKIILSQDTLCYKAFVYFQA